MAQASHSRKVERELIEPGIRRRRNGDGSAVYEVDYRDSSGVQRRETIRGGLEDARDFKAQVRADKSRGKRIAPSAITLDRAAEAWLASLEATDVSANTIAAYRDSYAVHLAPRFGRRRLDAVTVQDVAEWLADARTVAYRQRLHAARFPKASKRPAAPYAPRSVQLALTTLGQVYRHARRFLSFAGESPAAALVTRERPKVRARGKVLLTPEQTAELIAAAPAAHADVIAFLAGTGARVGEALALSWREVDLTGRQITLRSTLDDRGRRQRPKSPASIRTIPIPGSLVRRLAELKLRTADTSADAPVFQAITATAMDRHNLTRRGLWVACEQAALPRISPHTLRHGHGSALLEQGWSLPAVSRRLGHRNTQVTASVYAHELQSLERTQHQQDQLDRLYGTEQAI
jgi:integrase